MMALDAHQLGYLFQPDCLGERSLNLGHGIIFHIFFFFI